jgi:Flp pilus assembly protein TadD
LKPDYIAALLGKGVALAKLGRTDEAKACAQKVLEIQPTQTKESRFDALQQDFKKKQEP